MVVDFLKKVLVINVFIGEVGVLFFIYVVVVGMTKCREFCLSLFVVGFFLMIRKIEVVGVFTIG